jgi:hypothetical protein
MFVTFEPERLSDAIGSHRCSFGMPSVMAMMDSEGRIKPTIVSSLKTKHGDQRWAELGEGGRLWQFGGAAILNVPGTHIMAIDLPKVPKVYEAHRTNLDALRSSPLDWSMLCPGPMIASENGKPTGDLRLSVDEWPMTRPAYTYVLPRLALAFAFKQRVPELTISYEDAAEVILDNLSKSGRFSRRRVGVALPPGLRKYKDDVPR